MVVPVILQIGLESDEYDIGGGCLQARPNEDVQYVTEQLSSEPLFLLPDRSVVQRLVQLTNQSHFPRIHGVRH